MDAGIGRGELYSAKVAINAFFKRKWDVPVVGFMHLGNVHSHAGQGVLPMAIQILSICSCDGF